MKRVIETGYIRVVTPLLCLFVFTILSCSSLKRVEGNGLEHKPSLLQLTVNESDFAVFNRQVQELGLVTVDFRPAISNVYGSDQNELWLTFRFINKEVLGRSYVS